MRVERTTTPAVLSTDQFYYHITFHEFHQLSNMNDIVMREIFYFHTVCDKRGKERGRINRIALKNGSYKNYLDTAHKLNYTLIYILACPMQ